MQIKKNGDAKDDFEVLAEITWQIIDVITERRIWQRA